ncbi:MAG: UDP-N-acetylglucosamine 2-epimerase (non-hydrolyzing) [Geobacteraceae bacterium]|nr:UDP-N-acetylglucosamine 2-epimerase (non-hydrolyzing) [Geobacteraceae bacterium]NTW79763.1 UDP-N-acetylglucosamine 2-epimerase (non-hydrolyzing) [Geobacteraceae bacterium]
MVILGTRPEAVKLAPVISALRNNSDFHTVVLSTAQHRQMLDQVLELFGIVPDYDLNIMTANQTIADVTVSCLQGVGRILADEKPDFVIVQGDTTTVFASALACFYQRIPVGHVEAGLRTADIYSPYPEEANRRLASVLATVHFAPTAWAADNLKHEGIATEKIHVTGNTVIDALLSVAGIPFDLSEKHVNIFTFLKTINRLLLVTAHRRESFGDPFREMCEAMRDIVRTYDDVGIIYPVHPNPNVIATAHELLGNDPRILLVEPLDYVTFIHLMKHAHLLLTDSGGVQEEAPSLGKPVLIMREKTERQEGIEAGVTRLVGTSRQGIVSAVKQLLDNVNDYKVMVTGNNPFGDGKASGRIVSIISDYFRE